MIKYFFTLVFSCTLLIAKAQQPVGLQQNLDPVPAAATYSITGLKADALDKLDNAGRENHQPLNVGRVIHTQFTPANSGEWTEVSGGRVWRLKVKADDAKGISVMGKVHNLPEGATLNIYEPKGEEIVNRYTAASFTQQPVLASETVTGEEAVIEYFEPAGEEGNGNFTIEMVGYMYRHEVPKKFQRKSFGAADGCEVNVNCSEGDGYEDVQKSVVRIRVISDITLKWCTGSLVNNTNEDNKPYILSAMHCAVNFTDSVLINDTLFNYWIFYFNYEAPGCANPVSEGTLAQQSITGSQVRAYSDDGGGFHGSDFLLVELTSNVPTGFGAYYAGWSLDTIIPILEGASIHHPGGDIKKISTFKWPLSATNAYPTAPNNTHWQVLWAATANGHGVTEGGSSGSPIYNANKLVVGTLTGGSSSCANKTNLDYYGRMAYHWDKNGNVAKNRLKDWLDPKNSGVKTFNGSYEYLIGVGEVTRLNLELVPNPAENTLFFSHERLQDNQNKQITVINMLGQVVIQQQAEQNIVAVQHLPQGVYFMEVQAGKQVFTAKFVKQ